MSDSRNGIGLFSRSKTGGRFQTGLDLTTVVHKGRDTNNNPVEESEILSRHSKYILSKDLQKGNRIRRVLG